MFDDKAPNSIRSIVIVGGGTAGWMAAALFGKLFDKKYSITLVESDDIGTIGVGEATIPAIKTYTSLLGVSEFEVLSATQGIYKLGIEFVDWRRKDHSYIHSFGKIGRDLLWLRTHQYWRKMYPKGGFKGLEGYAINAVAMRQNRFANPRIEMDNSPLQDLVAAYHFDAGLFAKFLRTKAEGHGVVRREGRITQTVLRPDNGHIDKVVLQSGEEIAGDLFIDCSGMAALLIGKAMGVGYHDWGHWLLCDRAVAVPCESVPTLTPYTRSTARDAGWQWRIPLQHRTGNGHVYASRHMSEDEATSILMNNLDGAPRADPFHVKFTPGRRHKAWVKNCVAIGLSGGFIEPLESTSIHMIQTSLMRLVHLFPDRNFNPVDIAEYNRRSAFEYEDIRDFIITHYKVTERDDTRFWRECRNMDIPDGLRERLALFKAHGRYFRRSNEELFVEESWIQVLVGQGAFDAYDPSVDIVPEDQIAKYLLNVEEVIEKCAASLPTHNDYIAQYCKAAPPIPALQT